MITCIILAIIFLIIGISLFNGKGGWLIAGYNTLTNKEKEEYDKNALFKAVAWVCIVCCVLLLVMGYLGNRVDSGILDENVMLVFAVIFIFAVVLSIVLAARYISRKSRK